MRDMTPPVEPQVIDRLAKVAAMDAEAIANGDRQEHVIARHLDRLWNMVEYLHAANCNCPTCRGERRST